MIFIVLIGMVLSVFFVSSNQCDIKKSPAVYLKNDISSHTKYINFIKKYIVPEKLGNFLNVEHIDFFYVEKYDSGMDSLQWFQYEAYTELFYQMFDKNRNGYEDCPVTESFKSKYGKNLFEYYELQDVIDSSIDCGITIDDMTLIITEAGDFNVGEPGYIFYHHFHYVLDDDGNVDDVIFDYTE